MKQVIDFMADNNRIDTHSKRNIHEELSNKLGNRYREYRYKWNNAISENLSFPINLDFELSDSCNLSCSFCPRNRETHPSLPYEINTNKVLDNKLIDKILTEVELLQIL
jgi:2-iminoacetate synthase ThiH